MSSQHFGYFPGCSGLGTSLEYERSTRAVCGALGVALTEVPDWNCCGSSPVAHTADHALSSALASRIFAQAESVGIADIITPCPSCLKNLHNALRRMEDPLFRARVEALTQRPLRRAHTTKSVLQVLVEDVGCSRIRDAVRRPLKGLRVAPYYGCLLTRPGDSMKFDNPENPVSLDRLLESLGAEVLPFPLKVECCGAAFGVPARDVVPRLSGKLLDLAAELDADAVVVACPLCQMNLDLRQDQINAANGTRHSIPVPYFTQLMAYAFGLGDEAEGFAKLAVSMAPAFARMEGRAAAIERQEREAAAREAKKAGSAAEKKSAKAASAPAGGGL
ncbi:MAG: CoB--CoM heterodisulfide reductase iron-sulfur subunit B family protein [Desulfovibrio sp.]|jgi:heterodisulfide reductase subunit B|nr:CoB--CoM heterodisulfide reductase iron-sulfur subunit B family protein [Desulfovibrio sp.]